MTDARTGLRPPWLPAAATLFAWASLPTTWAALFFAPAPVGRALAGGSALGAPPLGTIAAAVALFALAGAWLALSGARASRDTPGRLLMRLAALGFVVAGATTGALAWAAVTAAGLEDNFARAVYGGEPLPAWVGHVLAGVEGAAGDSLRRLASALPALLLLDGVARLGTLLASLLLWFRVPAVFRARVWLTIDALLTVGFLAATATLPLIPNAAVPGERERAALRLAATVAFGVRAFVRALPLLFDGVERVGFRAQVAARHLRTRGSRFVTTIGTLSVLAVAFSSCSLTTTLSVMGGFRHDLKRKILGNTAHAVVSAADGDHPEIDTWEPLVGSLRQEAGVRGASPFVTGEVMVSSATNLAGAVLRGVEITSIGAVSDLPRNLNRGKLEYLTRPEAITTMIADGGADPLGSAPDGNPADPPEREADGGTNIVLPGVILGQELARSLRVYVGDEVNIVSPLGDLGPSGPIPKSRPFRVAGVFYSGMYEYDLKNIYVRLDVGQRFLGTGNAIHGVDIKIDDPDRASALASAIRAKLPASIQVQDWQELNRTLFGALALEKLAMFVALGLAILVAGFCVFGTLTLMIQEKGREIGVLQAMGAARADVLRIFLTEGLLIGAFGAALGLSFGFTVCYVAEHWGVPMKSEVYYIDRLPIHVDVLEFTLVGLASTTICLLATLLPAWLASRTAPVEALRFS